MFNHFRPQIVFGKDGGGGGGYSPPQPPDPAATAAAQGVQDRKTALTNAVLLNPSVTGPYGNISYDTMSYNLDDTDKSVNRPTQTISLSPEQQSQYDLRNKIMARLGELGNNWANTFQSDKPLTFDQSKIPTSIDYRGVAPVGSMEDYSADRDKAGKAYYDRAYSFLKPDMDYEQQRLENHLTQAGNPLGSEVYQGQMDKFSRNRTQQLQALADQSVNQGYNIQNMMYNNSNVNRQQQIGEAQRPYQTQSGLAADQFGRETSQQNQNINAMASLLQGSQAIQNPTTQTSPGYNQSALRSPDLAGMTQSAYNSQLQNYNMGYQQNQAQNNAMTSGLFGIGSAVAGPLSSWLFG